MSVSEHAVRSRLCETREGSLFRSLGSSAREHRRPDESPAVRDRAGGELQSGEDATADDDALAVAVRAHVSTGHHRISTCRMGPDHEAQAALDGPMQVRGKKRLRVVDSSAFPDQIGGNPNAPVMTMAEKAADMILGRTVPAAEDPRKEAA